MLLYHLLINVKLSKNQFDEYREDIRFVCGKATNIDYDYLAYCDEEMLIVGFYYENKMYEVENNAWAESTGEVEAVSLAFATNVIPYKLIPMLNWKFIDWVSIDVLEDNNREVYRYTSDDAKLATE